MRRIFALLAVLTVALSACYSGNPLGTPVGIVGDSITWLSQGPIDSDFANYSYDVRSYPGATMAQMLPQLQQVMAENPTDVLINAGTNDVHLYATYGDGWKASLFYESMVAQPAPCVILTTVLTEADGFIGGQPIAEAVNAGIEQSVAANHNFHLLDWNAIINSGSNYATYIDQTSLVHPNAAGQQFLADQYLHAVQSDCGN